MRAQVTFFVTIILLYTSNIFALELKGLAGISAFSRGKLIKKQNETILHNNIKPKLSYNANIELSNNFKRSKVRIGGGVAYQYKVIENIESIVPQTIPVYLLLAYGNSSNFKIFSPYTNFKFGVPFILSKKDEWQNFGKNWIMSLNFGVLSRGRWGAEVGYEYKTIRKKFSSQNYIDINHGCVKINAILNFRLRHEMEKSKN